MSFLQHTQKNNIYIFYTSAKSIQPNCTYLTPSPHPPKTQNNKPHFTDIISWMI